MIFIGGISSAVKQLEYLKTVICSVCGGYGRYQVFMTYTYFSFFFIPLFKWNRKFYLPSAQNAGNGTPKRAYSQPRAAVTVLV